MKKFVNVISLVVMVSVNVMTPFVYAADDDVAYVLNQTENSSESENPTENTEPEGDKTSGDDLTKWAWDNTGLSGWNTGLSGENTGLSGENTGLSGENTGLSGENTGLSGWNTGLSGENTELSWWNTELSGWNTELSWWNTELSGWNTELSWWNTELSGWNTELSGWNTELSWWNTESTGTAVTGSEFSEFYDIVYTWTVRWKEYTIILMDRNLWAVTTGTQDEGSYGYYYQWWNNYWFSHHTELNQYSTSGVNASWYGPDNRFVWENFIRWRNDWSTVSNGNLWWWWLDSEENDYNAESNRQWPCPTGYHVPSVWEWHALWSSFLANNGIDEATTSWLVYPDYIWKEGRAAYYLEREDIEKFKETFNISYAWRIKTNAEADRIWSGAHLWTSTPVDGKSLGFEVWDNRINLWWWATIRGTAYPVRCFKSVEYELIDYTITYVDGENETTEIKHWWDTLTEPLHTQKWTWYNWLWWYVSGSDSVFDFTGTQITWDITLVATW